MRHKPKHRYFPAEGGHLLAGSLTAPQLVCLLDTSCIQYACPWLCPAFTLAVPSGLPPN